MGFDLNKKVRWENLSPSLQSKFKWLDTQLKLNYQKILENMTNISRNSANITMNSSDLDALEKYLAIKIAELKKKISEIQIPPSNPTTEGTDMAFAEGFFGQVAKVNPGGKNIFPHDNFEQLKVVNTQAEFDSMTQIKQISLKEVFNTWYRYAHFDSAATHALDNTNWEPQIQGQNLNDPGFTCYTDHSQNGWSYNEATQQICCNVDGYPTTGFILPNDGPSSWMMRTRIDSNWDDDNFMIIVGYMKDSNGIEHTLSVTRACGFFLDHNGWVDCKFNWGLIYDMGWVSQYFIWDGSLLVKRVYAPDYPICYMTVVKNYDKLECRTTRFSTHGEDTTDVPEWTFTFGIPDQKPAEWPQEMYDNIKIMLRQTSRIGFGCRSDTGRFSIDKQKYIFDDDKIYRLDTDEVYYYDFNSGGWIKIGRVQDYLAPYSYLFNPKTKKLFFYPGYGAPYSVIRGEVTH